MRGWGAAMAAWVLGVGAAQAQDAVQDYAQVFEALDRAVTANYYDPRFGGLDWPQIRDRHAPAAIAATSDAAFQRAGQAMLNELGVSHVALHAPGTRRATMGVGARRAEIEGQSVVVHIDPASGARAAGLRIGDRILEPSAVAGPASEPARLEVERCDGSRASLSVPRESAYWPPRQKTIGWSLLRRGDGRSVGYIKADRFEDDGAELIDEAMQALADTDGLIVDLRDNTGGNASALRLLAYFGRPGPALALLSRDYLAGLDGPVRAQDMAAIHRADRPYTDAAVFQAVTDGQGAAMLMIEDIGDARYDKPVVVLIGPETASAAEGFAWAARQASDAVLIGRESDGALLSSERFDLPGGWAVTLPVHGIWGPTGEDFGDRAVPPQIETTWTRAQVCRDDDPDLAEGTRALERAWADA